MMELGEPVEEEDVEFKIRLFIERKRNLKHFLTVNFQFAEASLMNSLYSAT